jgi:hypothetical protein
MITENPSPDNYEDKNPHDSDSKYSGNITRYITSKAKKANDIDRQRVLGI